MKKSYLIFMSLVAAVAPPATPPIITVFIMYLLAIALIQYYIISAEQIKNIEIIKLYYSF